MDINAKRRKKYRRNTKEKLCLIFSKDTENVLLKLRTGNASAEHSEVLLILTNEDCSVQYLL